MEKIKKYFLEKKFKKNIINKIFCLWEQRFPQGTPDSYGTIGDRVLFLSLTCLRDNKSKTITLYLDIFGEVNWKN